MTTIDDNPDRALLERVAASGQLPAAFDANPLARDLDARIEAIDRTLGSVTLSFAPGPRYLQGWGVVQGGIVATLLDFGLAMAALARLSKGQSLATLTLTTHFLKPAMPGRLQVVATVDRLGRSAAFASGRCLQLADDGSASVVATATSALSVVPFVMR